MGDGRRCGNDNGWYQMLTSAKRADFLVNMSASADVLAQAKVEIDLAAIPEGKNVRLQRSPFFGHEPPSTNPSMWSCHNIQLWRKPLTTDQTR